MVLESNIIIDKATNQKVAENTLNIAEHLLLSLANVVARLFSACKVYVGAQQQKVTPPALFVDYYAINSQQSLAYTSRYDFGFEIKYVPKDSLSSAELSGAIFTLQQGIFRIPTDIGEYSCYSKNSDITDGLANVTGLVTISEQELDVEPIITTKELNV